ncbi:M1 family metallopeptidase [Streptomyces sp. BI20]|uniref:M1 family metallopeptidase n=1 Tax=Streptomyces sp. BI20 TaxID=3403460 RepID=UPI003C78D27F
MYRRVIAPSVLAASLLLVIPASAATYGPGAPGIGDPYYPGSGNGGYDVSHYDLRLKYQPTTDLLEGTATLVAKATQDLSRFNLDFGLKVNQITVNGKPARFTTSGTREVSVTPASPVAKDKPLNVVVTYAGKPSEFKEDGWSAWHRTPDGGVAAQEPDSAAWWFPSNDHPLDKATFDVSVNVPDGTQAISNGTLQSTSSRLGWTRYNWRSNKPQATYLATLAVGRFDITTDTTASGLPIVNAYSKDLGDNAGAARASLERTGEVAEWLEGHFGPYPFNALGGYVPNVTAGFALETQTRPFYGPRQFNNGANVQVVVHELAHQWYGDSVSVDGWKDIWLNEGFARYAQWLWSEKEGEGTAQELSDWAYSTRPAEDPFWQVKPGDPGPDNQFHLAVYDRGAIAVQALRNEVGDKAFFEILKGWPTERKYGNAKVSDFVKYAEKVSGKKVGPVLDTWLYQAGKPAAPTAPKPVAKPAKPGKQKPGAVNSAPERARSAAPVAPKAEPRSWKRIAATDTVHETGGHAGHGH